MATIKKLNVGVAGLGRMGVRILVHPGTSSVSPLTILEDSIGATRPPLPDQDPAGQSCGRLLARREGAFLGTA